jgi:hypothetical protein
MWPPLTALGNVLMGRGSTTLSAQPMNAAVSNVLEQPDSNSAAETAVVRILHTKEVQHSVYRRITHIE